MGDSLVVVAPWHKYSGDRIKIIIEPGMAFGTGHHGTTRMCLEEIEELARRGCRSLLDVGTGTGILAIAARKLGFTEVVGVDIDPEAVTIAVENARINGVEEVRFFCKPVREVEGSFDLIAANLTAQTIKDLMDDMLRHLKGDGFLILSGILSEQKEEIEELLRQRGISCLKVRELEGWLTFLASPI
ncbi:MAG: 50S ribosomal protein L11 methyltransferase [Nitrospirae bacterium]|nr:MAG: 50S ribosomal protein L11 methyltransferase [Nitrospirota bacterium]